MNYDNQLDEDVLTYLLEIGALRPEEEKLARMRSRAEALRNTPYGSGKMVSGHYIPTSPWQDVATLGGQLAGIYGDYKTDKDEQELFRKRRSALEGFTKRRRPGADPAVDYAAGAGTPWDEY
jgi:hypothetical protein